jgi:hypothetical protein
MSSTTTDPIREVVDNLRSLEPRIEHEPDPRNPNRIAYRITARSRDRVQGVIDNLFASVEGGFGYVNFTAPTRCEDGYQAIVQVVLYGLQAFEPRVA